MITLTDWVSSWIDRRSIRLAPSTISGYRSLVRLYVAPSAAGAEALEDVRAEHLIVMLSPIIAAGHTRCAQLVQIVVGGALHDAVRQHILPWSPMDSVDKIRHHKRMAAWLDVDQARRLLDTARDEGDPYYIAWLLALCCGLRRGELLGLMWTDIDLDGKLLHVRRQRVRVDRQVLETAPKSDASIRDIPIADDVAAELRTIRRRGARYVIASGRKPVTDCMLADGLRDALARAGLPVVTLHGLRHTMAATAATAGVSIKVLQAMLGHAQYSTTADVYAHVDRAAIRTAAGIISFQTIGRGARLEIV